MADQQNTHIDVRVKDITGQQFGYLTVLGYDSSRGGLTYWSCRCVCGRIKVIAKNNLTGGSTRSCGCKRKEFAHQRDNYHGQSGSPEHVAWAEMIRRCEDPKRKEYPHYGGRGICVCERWRTSFANFLADMGERPSREYTIDRIDTNGHYEPGNCRWATQKQQQRNRSNNVLITFRGRTQCMSAWAEEFGVHQVTLRNFIVSHKWTTDELFDKLSRSTNS